MEKINYIKADNNQLYNISAFKKIIKHATRVIRDGDDIFPYKKVYQGEPLRKFLGITIKCAEKDCYSLCGKYCGAYHNSVYYSLKELCQAIIKYFRELHPYGYGIKYTTEGYASLKIAKTRDAIYFDEGKNAICTKPYLEFVIDEFHDDSVFKIFETEKEMDEFVKEIGVYSL